MNIIVHNTESKKKFSTLAEKIFNSTYNSLYSCRKRFSPPVMEVTSDEPSKCTKTFELSRSKNYEKSVQQFVSVENFEGKNNENQYNRVALVRIEFEYNLCFRFFLLLSRSLYYYETRIND